MSSPTEPEWDPLRYERPFWEPIGRLVVNFGHLEKNVDWSIAALLRVHLRQGEAVTSQILNLTSRIRLINKLCSLLTGNENERREMKEITACVSKVNMLRNKVVHGPWGIYSVTDSAYQKTWVDPRDFKWKHVNITAREIEEASNDCVTIGIKLHNKAQAIANDYDKRKAELPP